MLSASSKSLPQSPTYGRRGWMKWASFAAPQWGLLLCDPRSLPVDAIRKAGLAPPAGCQLCLSILSASQTLLFASWLVPGGTRLCFCVQIMRLRAVWESRVWAVKSALPLCPPHPTSCFFICTKGASQTGGLLSGRCRIAHLVGTSHGRYQMYLLTDSHGSKKGRAVWEAVREGDVLHRLWF